MYRDQGNEPFSQARRGRQSRLGVDCMDREPKIETLRPRPTCDGLDILIQATMYGCYFLLCYHRKAVLLWVLEPKISVELEHLFDL